LDAICDEPGAARGSDFRRRTDRPGESDGALGADQAGVYEALSADGHRPDWISGISIGALELHQQALVPVADLPVLEVGSGVHILSDLTLGRGEVVYDYLEGTWR
jgi:hypothetical protein